jgi:hypothetical protein
MSHGLLFFATPPWCAALLFTLALIAPLQAGDPLVLDLPLHTETELPAWISVQNDEGGESFALWSAHISPVHPEFSLAVTIYSEGTDSGFLRVFWQGNTREEMVASNILENTGAGGQRTIVLSPEMLRGGGYITLQSASSYFPVRRIRFDWVHPEEILQSSNGPRFSTVLDHGKVLLREEVEEAAETAPAVEWLRAVADVPLSEKAEPVDSGAGYVFVLPRATEALVLHMEVAGLPPDGTVTLWIDGRKAGFLQIEVPALSDTGYLRGLDGALAYYGWRKASLYLDGNSISTGAHTLQFDPSGPAALRQLRLQVRYSPAPPVRPDPTLSNPTPEVILEPDSTLP